MTKVPRYLVAALAVAMLAAPAAAQAGSAAKRATGSFDRTKDMHALGISPRAGSFLSDPATANSDLAFWGDRAFQGSYQGFRVIDISSPAKPRELVEQECDGNQGDVVVFGDILVRSWNSPAPAGGKCDGEDVPEGFEGLHVFDISNIRNPDLVASIPLPCGSHTATGVPDRANGRLIVYSNVSSGCDAMDIVSVPLGNPAGAARIGEAPLAGPTAKDVNTGCHDVGVILGGVNRAACASADTVNVWDISDPANPAFLYTVREPGVGDLTQGSGRWHSAGYTWDGRVLILGWEPGGGSRPRCTRTGTPLGDGLVQTDTHKSLFFYDAATGAKLGQWVLPRDQTLEENCTIHNFNAVPLRDRYVVVSGNYQSGISAVDFTNPARPREIAFADPAPLEPTQLGGDWSTYWYNGRIYESDITRGLLVWKLSDRAVAGARKLPYFNPQTQERVID